MTQARDLADGKFDTNTLVVDAANNRVGIGTASPATAELDVSGKIRASSGVLFSTDTADANLLNDYEEGTWTPTFGTNSGSVATADSTAGYYTKVGRVVTVVAVIANINSTGTTSGSQLRIQSLPYTVDVEDTHGTCLYDNAVLQSNRTQMVAEANTGDFILFRQMGRADGGTISDTPMDHSDIVSGSTDLRFTVTYFTDQ